MKIHKITLVLCKTLLALGLTDCRTTHVRSFDYSYMAPKQYDDGIDVSDLKDAGIDIAVIENISRLILMDSFPNIHSLLIQRGNKLVYENYFSGYDQINARNIGYVSHTKDSLHDCRSITKSIISACIGIAVKRGLIKDIDEPVFNYFPEYSYLKDSIKEKITIRHLLTMTSGLKWNEYISYANPLNSEIRMNLTRDPIKFILSRKAVSEPGTKWVYNGGNTQLLAKIVEKVSGQLIEQFVTENLFKPLGIKRYEWSKLFMKDTEPSSASGLRLTSRDILKIGSLYMNDGAWKGNQILEKEWTANSFKGLVKRDDLKHIKEGDYGYQFWLYQETTVGTIVEAKGNGGNSIFFCKELDLLVVVTAGNYNKWKMMQNSYTLLRDYIIPATRR